MYEFVVVSGYVGSARERGELAAELDDYGSEGYLAAQMDTVVLEGRPYTTVIMEKALDDEEPPGGELSILPGGLEGS